MKCKNCDTEIEPIVEELTENSPHYAKEICPNCETFLKWLPKPYNLEKRSPNKYNAKILNIAHCEMCLRSLLMLGKNETIECHHVEEIKNGGKDILPNIWWICTSCHKEIHHLRFYFFYNQKSKIGLEEINQLLALHNVPLPTQNILKRIFKAWRDER